MCKTFILVIREAEKLGEKHVPIFLRHPVNTGCPAKLLTLLFFEFLGVQGV